MGNTKQKSGDIESACKDWLKVSSFNNPNLNNIANNSINKNCRGTNSLNSSKSTPVNNGKESSLGTPINSNPNLENLEKGVKGIFNNMFN